MAELIISLERAIPMMLAIFIAVFFGIILLRLIISFLLENAYRNYQSLKKKAKIKFSSSKNFRKEDEELLRKLDALPKAHSAEKAKRKAGQQEAGSYEVIESDEQEIDRKSLAEVKIVDIVKPVGFWTSMILGQKLTYLVSAAQIINQRSQKGFWVSMIEAKDRAAGRERGRGL
jgi:hypothetical protein